MLKKVSLILSLVCASTSHGITPVPHTSANTRKKEITHAGKKTGMKKKIPVSKNGSGIGGTGIGFLSSSSSSDSSSSSSSSAPPPPPTPAQQLASAQETLSSLTPGTDLYIQLQNIINNLVTGQTTNLSSNTSNSGSAGNSPADQLAAAQQTLSTLTPGTNSYNQQQNLVNAMQQAQASGPAITPSQLSLQAASLSAAGFNPALAGTAQGLSALHSAGFNTAGFVVAGSQAALQQVAQTTYTPAQLAALQAAGLPATSGGQLTPTQAAVLSTAGIPVAASQILPASLVPTTPHTTPIPTPTLSASVNSISDLTSQTAGFFSTDTLAQSAALLSHSQQALAQIAQAGIDAGLLHPTDPSPLLTTIASNAFTAFITGSAALTQFLTANPDAVNQALDTAGRNLLQIVAAGNNSNALVSATLQLGGNINSLASINKDGILVWTGPRPLDQKTQKLVENTLQLQQILMDASTVAADVVPLILAGAILGATTSTGDTALTSSLSQGTINPSIIFLLLNAGININAQNNNGQTALFNATQAQASLAVIQNLLAHGANESINAKDAEGKTALSQAIENGDTATTKFLLNSGANVFLSTINSTKPTKASAASQFFVMRDETPTTQGIITNTKALITGLATPPKTALAAKDIQKLIGMGAAVNATDNNGKTALFYAATKNNLGACVTLLNAGANAFDLNLGDIPVSQDPNSTYALILDPSRGMQQFFKRWKSFAGAPVPNPTLLPLRRSRTPSIYIHGATDDNGATALHYMARCGNAEWTQKFMSDGASSAAQDKTGATPWHTWAMGWVDGNNDAAYQATAAALNPTDADIADYNGATPLMLTSGSGHLGAVKVLLANTNVNISATDLWGDTPLHWAAGNSNLATCAALIAQFKTLDLLLDTQNVVGKTAAHYAASAGAVDVYNALKKAGASTTIKDSFGKSPAILLKEYGSGK